VPTPDATQSEASMDRAATPMADSTAPPMGDASDDEMEHGEIMAEQMHSAEEERWQQDEPPSNQVPTQLPATRGTSLTPSQR
jgi:hypothetical protein